MRDHILLYINGRRHEVRGSQVFQPLSDFVRSTLRQTGTKVVCAEGDCGSCTVLIGRVRDGRLTYKPVTSCIQYVAQLDGAHVITVEGLADHGQLHPVQEAMVAHHGAQCGYCTPGMVVSMCGLLDRRPDASPYDVTRALVGNLCRCTGYASILDAAAHVDRKSLPPLAKLYDSPEMLADLKRAAGENVEVRDATRIARKPAALADAIRMRSADPQATILAGGTDLGVVWNKGKRQVGSLLCLGEVPELRGCDVDGNTWTLGANATIADVEASALDVLPAYGQMLERFGSPPIKNAGTLGGNLANGSPIGDSMPALMVLDAQVELVGPHGSRRVNMNQFYTGYRQNVLAADELIARVVVPLPAADDLLAVYKISKRRDLDISSFTAAVWMRLDGETIGEAKIAYGGVAATIVRLPTVESWLRGKPLDETTMREAGRLARAQIKPITDVRGSADYRATLAENILVKFGREMTARHAMSSNGT